MAICTLRASIAELLKEAGVPSIGEDLQRLIFVECCIRSRSVHQRIHITRGISCLRGEGACELLKACPQITYVVDVYKRQ